MTGDIILLLVAAFAGGALNAAAGGGTFLTLPALMLVGVPSVAANATGTVALLPGYVASAWGFREDVRGRKEVHLGSIALASVVGGVLGASLLLVTSNAVFRTLIPWLMLIGTLWFAGWPLIEKRLNRTESAGALAVVSGVFAVSVYGGYFNGGLGIILLALFGALGFTDLNFMNGLKNLVSAVLTAIAVVVYAAGGAVVWPYAALMMVAAVLGGYVGARVARRLPPIWLRAGIVAVGTIMTIIFFIGW
jgi:uncharacterized membrane protein YfcA